VIFNVEGKPEQLSTAFYQRELLKACDSITGPAIVEQFDSTVVVNPGLIATVDQYGTIIIACR
jgi:N-methylhydantoinase A/oxoprolinase/acetone carboxylase beta subunit